MTLLLEAGVPVNARDVDNFTPLHLALAGRRKVAVKPLIAAKADIQAVDRNGTTTLHWAARSGHVSMVTLLLEAGVPVNARDIDNYTPLHLALIEKRVEATKALIAAKADVHAIATNGSTPLHWAAQNNLSSLVVLLLETGAIWDFKKAYETDAYQLTRIYSVIKPCFSASNLLWLANCIEGRYLAQAQAPVDLLLTNQEALKKFLEENFEKIEALFFAHHAKALQEAEERFQISSGKLRSFLKSMLLKYIADTYFSVRAPEVFWEPFLGALALQNSDYRLLLKTQNNDSDLATKLCQENRLPNSSSLVIFQYHGWCPHAETHVSTEDQGLRDGMMRTLGEKPCDIGISLFEKQLALFALCRAHFNHLDKCSEFTEILDSPGRLLPAFEMMRRDGGQQQQQKDKAGAGQDPKPTPKADPKLAPGVAPSAHP